MRREIDFTWEHLGPTAWVSATVRLTWRLFTPSSFVDQSWWIIFDVFRALWKSTRNLDLENSSENNVSTLIGSIVWTSWRPSCIELHSAVLTNGMLLPFSESLESDMSVGNWSVGWLVSTISSITPPPPVPRLRPTISLFINLRCCTLGGGDTECKASVFDEIFSLFLDASSLPLFVNLFDEAVVSECGSEWSL